MRNRVLLALTALVALVAVVLPASADQRGDAAWHRIDFDRPITAVDRAAVEAAGAEALQYAPHDAYLAWASADTAATLTRLDGVASVRPVRAAEKVDPGLPSGPQPVAVAVVMAAGAADAVGAALGALGVEGNRFVDAADGSLETIEALAPGALAGRIAALPGVLHVGHGAWGLFAEDEGTAQILAGNIGQDPQGNAGPVPGYRDFLDEVGLSGEGVVFTIADTGLERDHPEFAGRIEAEFFYNAAGTPDRFDQGGHGTHVAGIVGGMGATVGPAGPVRDAAGQAYGLGIAPAVRFVNQALIAGNRASGVFPPDDFERFTSESVGVGSIGWNASWTSGGQAGAGYVPRARSLDVVTRDADFSEEGNQPFTMVFSAGNSGSGNFTLTQPKEAKNIIVVASSRSQRTTSGAVPFGGLIDTISSFSSRGPARDGRIAPTVAAPGENVASAKSFTGTSCAVPFPDGAGLYATCSGTSMASPHVAGAVVLIHEWWGQAHDGASPSPAMARALLVNTAVDINAGTIPNQHQGWGRVHLGNLFDPTAERVYVDEDVVLTDVGESHTVTVVPADPDRPLRVTLAWTDAPGAPGANPALVNDLDLVVEGANGTSWLGNSLAGGLSVTGGSPDRLNNVENVFLGGPAGDGPYTITVRAANLPAPAIPGHPAAVNQDFALVVANARLASG